MAKLEQLSELLISEISQFEKTVERLEKIQQEKIGIDSAAFEKLLLKHQEKLEKGLSDHSMDMKDLGAKLEEAKAYPIWALIVFVISIVLNGIFIYAAFY
jgi:ABC-type phosphate transport system auxiliary subunit